MHTPTLMSNFGILNKMVISHWVLVFFLLGTIIDSGGGFYVKQMVFAFALFYLLINQQTYAIWLRCFPDILVIILIPVVITIAHLIFSPGLNFEDVFEELWRRLGPAAYFLFIPLIYFVGTKRTAKWLVLLLSSVAMVTILLMLLHLLGFINMFEYTEFMMKHRMALFGVDNRGRDLDIADIGIPNFGVSQAFPSFFSFAMVMYPALSVVLATAIIVGMQRGQFIGLVIALFLPLLEFRKGLMAELRRGSRFSLKVIKIFMPVALLVIVAVILIAFYMSDVVTLLLYKYEILASMKDESASIRIAHIAGYWKCVTENPLGLIWGFGPNTIFYNEVRGERIFMTEMVMLIYSFWYGLIYAAIFLAWIGLRLWRLSHHFNDTFNTALFMAIVVLIIIGNINPVLHTPLAFFLLAMTRVREFEIVIQNQ